MLVKAQNPNKNKKEKFKFVELKKPIARKLSMTPNMAKNIVLKKTFENPAKNNNIINSKKLLSTHEMPYYNNKDNFVDFVHLDNIVKVDDNNKMEDSQNDLNESNDSLSSKKNYLSNVVNVKNKKLKINRRYSLVTSPVKNMKLKEGQNKDGQDSLIEQKKSNLYNLRKIDKFEFIYSPRYTFAQEKKLEDELFSELAVSFDPITLKIIKTHFKEKLGSLTRTEFIFFLKDHLISFRPDLPNRDRMMIKLLNRLFNAIDLNGKKRIIWEEFTNFIIDSSRNLSLNNTTRLKEYFLCDHNLDLSEFNHDIVNYAFYIEKYNFIGIVFEDKCVIHFYHADSCKKLKTKINLKETQQEIDKLEIQELELRTRAFLEKQELDKITKLRLHEEKKRKKNLNQNFELYGLDNKDISRTISNNFSNILFSSDIPGRNKSQISKVINKEKESQKISSILKSDVSSNRTKSNKNKTIVVNSSNNLFNSISSTNNNNLKTYYNRRANNKNKANNNGNHSKKLLSHDNDFLLKSSDKKSDINFSILSTFFVNDYNVLFVSTSNNKISAWKFDVINCDFKNINKEIDKSSLTLEEQKSIYYCPVFSANLPQYCLVWETTTQKLYSGQTDGNILKWSLDSSKNIEEDTFYFSKVKEKLNKNIDLFSNSTIDDVTPYNNTSGSIYKKKDKIASKKNPTKIKVTKSIEELKYLKNQELIAMMKFNPLNRDGVSYILVLGKLQLLAAGYFNGRIVIWDIITKEPRKIYTDQETGIYQLEYDPTKNLLFSCGFDHDIYIYDIYVNERSINKLVGHTISVNSIGYNIKENELISIDIYGNIKVWDLNTLINVQTISLNQINYTKLTSTDNNNNNNLLNTNKFKDKNKLDLKTIKENDGESILSSGGNKDGTNRNDQSNNDIEESNTKSNQENQKKNMKLDFYKTSEYVLMAEAAYKHQHQRRKISSNQKMIYLSKVNKILTYGENLLLFENLPGLSPNLTDDTHILGCFYDSKSYTLITVCLKKIKLWSIFTGQLLKTFTNLMKGNEITTYTSDKNFKKIYLGDHLGNIKSFVIYNGKFLKEFSPHKGEIITLIHFSKKNNLLSLGGDNLVKLHSEDTENFESKVTKLIKTFKFDNLDISNIAFSEEYKRLIVGSFKGKLKFFDIEHFRQDFEGSNYADSKDKFKESMKDINIPVNLKGVLSSNNDPSNNKTAGNNNGDNKNAPMRNSIYVGYKKQSYANDAVCTIFSFKRYPMILITYASSKVQFMLIPPCKQKYFTFCCFDNYNEREGLKVFSAIVSIEFDYKKGTLLLGDDLGYIHFYNIKEICNYFEEELKRQKEYNELENQKALALKTEEGNKNKKTEKENNSIDKSNSDSDNDGMDMNKDILNKSHSVSSKSSNNNEKYDIELLCPNSSSITFSDEFIEYLRDFDISRYNLYNLQIHKQSIKKLFYISSLPNLQIVMSTGAERLVKVIDVNTGKIIDELKQISNEIKSVPIGIKFYALDPLRSKLNFENVCFKNYNDLKEDQNLKNKKVIKFGTVYRKDYDYLNKGQNNEDNLIAKVSLNNNTEKCNTENNLLDNKEEGVQKKTMNDYIFAVTEENAKERISYIEKTMKSLNIPHKQSIPWNLKLNIDVMKFNERKEIDYIQTDLSQLESMLTSKFAKITNKLHFNLTDSSSALINGMQQSKDNLKNRIIKNDNTYFLNFMSNEKVKEYGMILDQKLRKINLALTKEQIDNAKFEDFSKVQRRKIGIKESLLYIYGPSLGKSTYKSKKVESTEKERKSIYGLIPFNANCESKDQFKNFREIFDENMAELEGIIGNKLKTKYGDKNNKFKGITTRRDKSYSKSVLPKLQISNGSSLKASCQLYNKTVGKSAGKNSNDIYIRDIIQRHN